MICHVMSKLTDGPIFFTGNDPLSLGSDLLNTVDFLATPADRLTTVAHLRAFLSGHEWPDRPVDEADLETARKFREQLRAVWQAEDTTAAADRLNRLLARHRPVAQLRADADVLHVTYGDRAAPATALVQEVLAALVTELAEHGVARLGSCAGDPCRCAFLDRSRNRNRRYCCDICTTRAAAAAYRRRQRAARRSGQTTSGS